MGIRSAMRQPMENHKIRTGGAVAWKVVKVRFVPACETLLEFGYMIANRRDGMVLTCASALAKA